MGKLATMYMCVSSLSNYACVKSYMIFKIDLGLTELHNVRDSVAPRSYVDSRSQAFSDYWAWLQG